MECTPQAMFQHERAYVFDREKAPTAVTIKEWYRRTAGKKNFDIVYLKIRKVAEKYQSYVRGRTSPKGIESVELCQQRNLLELSLTKHG